MRPARAARPFASLLTPGSRRACVLVLALAGVAVLPTIGAAQDVVQPISFRLGSGVALFQKADPELFSPPNRKRSDLREALARPGALIPLYASLGVLQGLDVHSTHRGLAAGGREVNPVMEPVVGNRAAFIAVKAATTVGVVWAAERLWRKDRRKAAVVLTALTNAGLAAVVAHNYRAAR